MQVKFPSLLARAGTIAIAIACSQPGAAENPVTKVPLVELDIRPLTGPSNVEPRQLVVRPGRPSRLRFETVWEGFGEVELQLVARAEPAGVEGAMTVTIEALSSLPDGRKIEASKRATVNQRAAILFELFRQDQQPFTLVIDAELSETWEIVQTPSVGAPVRFEIEVVRIQGAAQVSLERNMLNTFVNRPVRYEFTRGPDPGDEALTLSLTPMRLIDDLVEIKINLAGRLPGEDGITVLAREDNLIVNRGATSPVNATVGDPPVGYRFHVTPRF